MKKVMIGILILIPIIVLIIVAAVSTFISGIAHIAVDEFYIYEKAGTNLMESLTLELDDNSSDYYDFYDFVRVVIKPSRANNYVIEWGFADLDYMDEEYEAKYEKYAAYEEQINAIREEERLGHITLEQMEAQIAAIEPVEEVFPIATLVDEKGNAVKRNSSGKFYIGSFCRFKVIVSVENINKTFSVSVEGKDVKSITIANVGGEEDNILLEGQSRLVEAQYTPMSSVVSKTIWESDNPQVATVDENGVITAHSVGFANITVKANKAEDPSVFVTSSEYVLEVRQGASKHGSKIKTSSHTISYDELAISSMADAQSSESLAFDDTQRTVTVLGTSASITTSRGTVEIEICEEDDIAIQNENIYAAANGYVLEVSDLKFVLHAVWADMLKDGAPEGVAWTSSNAEIATVQNGVITAKSSGLVTINAQCGSKSASITLHVQVKIVTMQLKTSNHALAIGLARETVFAAEKFEDETHSSRVANGTYIVIVGAPVIKDDESQGDYAIRLAVFYDAYKFEVVSGSEYVQFDTDEVNLLKFKPEAIKEADKVKVEVLVSAKYPKYDSKTKFTKESVTLTIAYGIEVNDFEELKLAEGLQRDYANLDGNYVPAEMVEQITNTLHGRDDIYRIYNAPHSHHTYAIVLGSNVKYDKEFYDVHIRDEKIQREETIKLYGDLYGNNHILSADFQELADTVSSLLYAGWDNIVISNVRLRANELDKNSDQITANDANSFTGQCIKFASVVDESRYHLTNIKVEFCVLENGRRIGESINADVTFDGVVARNAVTIAFYVPTRMHTYYESAEDKIIGYPMFNNIKMNNCVFHNCLASIASFAYERFSRMPETNTWWDDAVDNAQYKTADGRFVRWKDAPEAEQAQLRRENDEFCNENFIKKGYNSTFTITGFLDIYNWQNANNASLISIGDKTIDNMIGAMTAKLLQCNSAFKPFTYEIEDDLYFHLGFVTSGISAGMGLFDETCFIVVNDESQGNNPIFTINAQELRPEGGTSMDERESDGVVELINKFSVKFYGYHNTSQINPSSKYVLNAAFIERLHS